jgi:hypothetical protein
MTDDALLGAAAVRFEPIDRRDMKMGQILNNLKMRTMEHGGVQ